MGASSSKGPKITAQDRAILECVATQGVLTLA